MNLEALVGLCKVYSALSQADQRLLDILLGGGTESQKPKDFVQFLSDSEVADFLEEVVGSARGPIQLEADRLLDELSPGHIRLTSGTNLRLPGPVRDNLRMDEKPCSSLLAFK